MVVPYETGRIFKIFIPFLLIVIYSFLPIQSLLIYTLGAVLLLSCYLYYLWNQILRIEEQHTLLNKLGWRKSTCAEYQQ